MATLALLAACGGEAPRVVVDGGEPIGPADGSFAPDYLDASASECQEGDMQACGSSIGVCESGMQYCESGTYGDCEASVGPTTTHEDESVDGLCNEADDDCDGTVDEGCDCTGGIQRGCGTDFGVCEAGMQTCRPNGTWGLCSGSREPDTTVEDESSEGFCNGEDSDCDGNVDEGCDCIEDEVRTCGSDEGVCTAGTQTCNEFGAFTVCSGTGPTIAAAFDDNEVDASLCNGADDDCDAEVDEGCECSDGDTRNCGSNIGVCEFGSQTCGVTGSFGTCEGAIDATIADSGMNDEALASLCNGLDDDCDGSTDEGCDCVPPGTRSCGSDEGVCQLGSETCQADGTWGACSGTVGPTIPNDNPSNEDDAALCNGDDDDCDGNVDEGCGCVPPATQACGSDVGVCSTGTETCQANGTFGSCTGAIGPTIPDSGDDNEGDSSLCNGDDDDCDGDVDEGCACADGDSEPCGETDEGVCEYGGRTCGLDGVWSACSGEVSAQARTCGDGLDYDCDGTADDLQGPCAPCTNTRLTNDSANDQRLDVAWNGTEYGVAYERDQTIYFLRVSSTGTAVGSPQPISTSSGTGYAPAITWSGTDYGVVWEDRRDGVGQIYFARVDGSAGTLLGAELRVTNTATAAVNCDVAWSGTEYGVTWEDLRSGSEQIYFSRVSAAGEEVGDDVAVTNDPALSYEPQIAWNTVDSEYAVVFADTRYHGGDSEILMSRVSSTGAILEELRITDAFGDSHLPAIAWTGTGYGVSWRDRREGYPNGRVFFSRVSTAGVVLDASGAGYAVSGGDGTNFLGGMATNGTEFVMVWNDLRPSFDEVFYAVTDSAGGFVQAATQMTNETGSEPATGYERVAWNGTDFGVFWYDGRNGGNELYFGRVAPDTGFCE